MKRLQPPEQMPLNSPQRGPNGETYVKLYVQDLPGKETEVVHNHGTEPYSVLVVWTNKALNIPEVVASTKDKTRIKFIPDWVSVYTSKPFLVILELR